jgi:tRNA (cmo5U34)-methyltransferase
MSDSSSSATFDEERAAAYDVKIRRLAPGYDVLHEAIASVADTMLPDEAHIIAVGVGTGAELATLGRTQPEWRFTAVDPSAEMLNRCRQRVEAEGLESRVGYVHDRVEDLSVDTRFDGATSVFVSHFLQDPAAKRRYFRAVARTLRPGSPLFFADLFGDPSGTAFTHRVAAWRQAIRQAGLSEGETGRTFDRIERQIAFVPEDELATLVNDAGLETPTRFYQCFLWGGWWSRKRE